jgi:hypothetical protein
VVEQFDLECTVAFARKANNIGEGRRGARYLALSYLHKDAPFKLVECKLIKLSSSSVKHRVAFQR